MKYFVVFCFVILAAVALVQSADDLRPEYCKPVPGPRKYCIQERCNKDNTQWAGVGCASMNCKGKKETPGDLSKPFPECCPKITCEP